MKQTNNAIKFLMAQYRAIFRNANLKMFFAAATAAAALSAGQAQAATTSWDALDGHEEVTDGTKPVTLSTAAASTKNFDITVKDTGKLVIAADPATAFSLGKDLSGSILLSGEAASVTIGNKTNGAKVQLTEFKATAGTLSIGGHDSQASSLEADKITLEGAAENAAGKTTPAVAVTLGKSGALGGDKSEVTIGTGASLSIEAKATDTSINGTKLTVNGGVVTVAKDQALDIHSATVNVNENSDFTNQGTVKFDKATAITFAKGTLNNTGTIDLGEVSDTRSAHIKVDAAQFGSLFKDAAKLSVSGGSAAGTLTIEADGTDAIDLQDSGLFTKKGKIDTTDAIASGGTATSINVTVKGSTATLGTTLIDESGLGDVNLEFATLNVGDGAADFTVQGKNTLTIKNELVVSGDHGIVIDSGAGLNLSGSNGTVTAKSITIGSDKDKATLEVQSGNWNTKSLIIKSGTATVGGATFVISGGDVSTKGTDGNLVVENSGIVDIAGASKVTLGSSGADLKTGGKLVLDQAKSFVIAAEDVTLNTKGSDSTFQADSVSGDKSAILQFNSATEQKISAKAAGKLKEKLAKFNGFLQFGDKLTLDSSNALEGEKEWNDVSGSAAIMGANDKVTLKADDVTSIAAVGNVKISTAGTKEFEVKDTALYLTNAGANEAGKFVMDSTSETAGLKLSGASSSVGFTSTGEVGSITAAAANSGSVSIGTANGTGNVSVKGSVGAESAHVAKVSVLSGSTLSLKGKDTEGLYANQLELEAGSTLDATGHGLVLGSGALASTLKGNLTAAELSLKGSGDHIIAGGAEVKLGKLTLENEKSKLHVGQDSAAGSSGILEVDELSLASGSLIIDPEFDKGLAIAHVKAFNKQEQSTDGGKDAQIVNGNIIVGKNSVAAIGFEKREDVISLLDSYGYLKTHENGTVNLDSGEGIQAALVLDDPITIASGNGVLIAPNKSGTDLVATDNTFKMDGNGALIVNDSVYVRGADGQLKGAAVTLKDGDANSVEASGKSKVILAGALSKADKGIQIFKTEKASINNPVKAPLTLETANGIFKAEIGADGKIGEFTFMDGAEERFKSFYKQSSAPVEQLLRDAFLGEITVDRNYAGATLVLAAANDKDDTTGVKADAAAHAATYAGAQQAAVAAVGTMAEAVGGRVGSMGVEATAITATGSAANGGVWVAPMYKSVDADGFNAQGASYGADVDLAGVAFGTDTVNGNMRFGAVFNIGSGDADGKGNGNGLKDEFDYYGFGIYSVMGFGNLALVGDASLNVISHDVSGESGLKDFGKLHGSADTTAVTMGLTGQYTISNPAVDVTPHLGVRFTRLDTDSYDLISDKGTVATTDFEVQNVFSIPLGVTLSKAFEMGGWSLAPNADFSITFNTGDTEVDSTTRFTGINRNLGLNTEVLDEVTYGVAVGLGAQYGAFGTNIGINYTGSENTDSFGVNAQARYMF